MVFLVIFGFLFQIRLLSRVREGLLYKRLNKKIKKKSGKVKVMYVRSDDDSDKRTQNPRTGKGG
ncbi:hypothetical protein ACVGW6_02900, partial [Enterobacter intestinihominis]